MPIYEYRCKTCGKKTEILFLKSKQSRNPTCCNKPMCKTIGRTTFILKGSGWYKDGYSKGGREQ
jgi:putative FmdB family regulatory protein